MIASPNQILQSARLPARLDAQQTAVFLGFQDHDIPVLVGTKLLEPLGNPAPGSPRYFASCDLIQLRDDRDWLNQATKAITRHWKQKNARKGALRRRLTG